MWWNAFLAATFLGLAVSGCSMADTATPKSPDEKYATLVDAKSVPDAAKKLDAEVIKFVRGAYTLKSAHYYRFDADVPWVAITKDVQNQMLKKSVKRIFYEWFEPGYDLIEIYPQGKTAFAVAMDSKTLRGEKNIVGYYVLEGGK
jgi:hypothetical protein